MHLSEAFTAFITSRIMAGHTRKTISHYRSSVGTSAVGRGISTPKSANLNDFFLWLATDSSVDPYKPSYIQQGNTGLCELDGLRGAYRAAKDPNDQTAPNRNHSPYLDEIGSLLKQFDQRRFAGIRNHTITLMLYDTGVRLSEAPSLIIPDIDWDDRFILIRQGKGQKDRWVPYSLYFRC